MNRVLIVANIRKSQGGITTQVMELKNSLLLEGLDVEVVSTHGSLGDRIYGIYSAFMKAKECDTILGVGCAYMGFFPMIVAYIVSVVKNKYVVFNFHDGQVKEFLKSYYGLVKVVLNNSKVIVATKYLNEEFKTYGFNSIIIQNHFNNLKVANTKHKNSEKIKIMWARSFEKLYRIDLALDSAIHYSGNKKVEFHFYGGGSEYSNYSEKYKSANIFFHGFMKREELLKEYKKYQVFLNTTEYDNFPMSIVEAGLNNMIVISSKVGGIESLYSEDEIVFFQSGSLGSLIETIGYIFADISKYNTYSINLAKKVVSFNWANVRKQWIYSLNIKTR